MNQIAQQFLSSKGPALVKELVGKLGIDAGQAEGFLGGAVGKIVGLVSGGGFDLSSLSGSDPVEQITSKIDVTALASETGLDADKAKAGLQTVLPKVLESFGGEGGAKGLLGKLGGSDDALGAAGKLFG